MSKQAVGHFASKIDPGKIRINNEDQVGAFINSYGEILLVVCDGMGGHNKGDYASNLAVKLLKEAFFEKKKPIIKFFTKTWIARTIRSINKQIYDEASKGETYKDMGTTLSMLLISKGKEYFVNIGDSRAYKFTNKRIEQITEDQTYVDYLYRSGQITKEEENSHPKRHILINALGIFATPSFDLKIMNYEAEKILLCSDGLYNYVSEKEILSIINTNDTIQEKVNLLIFQANANGGLDNIGVVLWEPNND